MAAEKKVVDIENNTPKKEKKPFKMPHLLWIMLGMILIVSLLTYIIPAGQFATDESGTLIGDEFIWLESQTPVNPIEALLDIFSGLTESAYVIMIVMICGASMQIFLDSKTFDKFLDWSIYKMQGRGETLLISVLFCLMVYLGAFGGSDALIAIVPIGVLFAKKLKLDPICAVGVSTFATMIGFGTGPTKMMVVQGLMETTIFGAFGTRFIIMNVFMIVGLLMVLRYVKKIHTNAENSLVYDDGWRPNAMTDKNTETKEAKLDWRVIVNMILFFAQYIAMTLYSVFGDSNSVYAVMAAIMLVVAIVQGIIARMSADEIGNSFAKGAAGMAFVGIVIGMARTVSIVMTDGNILHTIVYVVSRPLLGLPGWLSSIGMMIVISLINLLIPSATSKAAILVPIVKPIGEVLGFAPEMIVQIFQFGDGFTNIVSPLLGWTIGSLAAANVPYNKWLKWALPKVLIFLGMSAVVLIVLNLVGWTGTF